MSNRKLAAFSLDLAALRDAYAGGRQTPTLVAEEVLRRIAAAGEDHVWISRRPDSDILRDAAALTARQADAADLPLFGVPFAVKDNIDVAGLPTTAACPAFATMPQETAPVVAKLVAAGAILIGKTNLDQFATGLVGVRSPYGIPRNPFDAAMAPGGSSSGSAVAVAAGLVGFALGTDTAGSGRVPAAFNNLVGLKPTRGLLSTRGVVPACRSLDCVSIFALTVADATAVLEVTAGFDAEDAYSRPAPPGFAPRLGAAPAQFRFGVPARAQRQFFGDSAAETLFDAAIARAEQAGGTVEEIDFAPWIAAANLLYGPWVAERTAALGPMLRDNPEALHPVTRAIIAQGLDCTAVDLFRAQHRLAELVQATRPVWNEIDFLLVPTTGTAFTLAEIAAEPVARNTDLGFYTNFTNLFDLAAIDIPSGFTPKGFPAGITLIGPPWHDQRLAAYAARLHELAGTSLGATAIPQPPPGPGMPEARPDTSHPDVEIAVFGAHLAGQPLHPQLLALGARLRRACRTRPAYRLLALPAMPARGMPSRPGLLPTADGGTAIAGEVWAIPSLGLAAFLAGIAPPLGLGTVELEDGPCLGFICEGGALPGSRDISEYADWRAFRAASG